MLFSRWNVDHVSLGDNALLGLGGHDARALVDEEHLVAGVSVEVVAGASAEIDDVEGEVLADILGYHLLPRDRPSCEKRAVSLLPGDIADAEHFHPVLLILGSRYHSTRPLGSPRRDGL